MSKRKVESNAEKSVGDTDSWKVGPGSPPVEFRFQKGTSGNPAGRPRRSGAPGDRLLGATEPTRAMILDEAYRTVEVRDGDTVIRLPMNQAVFRAMGIAALSGSQAAQRRWVAMVQEAEATQKRAQLVIYNALERDEKKRAARLREWNEEEGDEVDPYKDDIIGDSRSTYVVVQDIGED